MRRALAVGCLALAGFAACTKAETPLPELGTVPPFALTSDRGESFTQDRLKGKVSVVSFIFTSCPSICPMLTARTAALQAKLAPLKGRVQIISFSVDPETDTPEVLAAYAKKYNADPTLWTFVTGDIGEVSKTVVKGFKVALGQKEARSDGAYDILHASHYALVDSHGVLRGFYASDDVREAALLADVNRLLEGP